MRSEILIIDTFIYDVVVLPVEYTTIEYRWFANESGIPVLQINAIEALGIESTTQVIYKEGNVINAINDPVSENTSLTILKNPVADNLVLDINTPAAAKFTIDILDINGKILYSDDQFFSAGQNNLIINISDLAQGLYLVILNENGNPIASEKLFK